MERRSVECPLPRNDLPRAYSRRLTRHGDRWPGERSVIEELCLQRARQSFLARALYAWRVAGRARVLARAMLCAGFSVVAVGERVRQGTECPQRLAPTPCRRQTGQCPIVMRLRPLACVFPGARGL